MDGVNSFTVPTLKAVRLVATTETAWAVVADTVRGVSSSGLNQNEVDARVKVGVLDWAEQGNTTAIPYSKIPASIARDSELPDVSGFLSETQVDARVTAGIADWAEDGNVDTIPEAKLPTSATEGLSQTEVCLLYTSPSPRDS